MPDDGLFAAAKGGTLNGEGLKKEVDRLLTDSRINRFVDDFSRQWLQLHRVGMFPPDKKLYPNYDAWLETSMRAEPVEFFREMFAKNLPIDGFLDSDWTMANARLCDFYGLPEPKTDGFQRVSLKPEDHRGGLLTMGASLGLTSDGTRHRPVHRGVWLSEVIFGKTPPPPPANVPAIEPNPPKSPKATLREKIEAHRSNANCAACHAKIDPLGLAWDNYDAIGQWRTREKVAAGRRRGPLDQSRRRDARRPSVQGCRRIQTPAARGPRQVRARLHRTPLHLRPPPRAHLRRPGRPQGHRGRSEEKPIRGQGHRPRRGPVRPDAQTLTTPHCIKENLDEQLFSPNPG